MTYSHPPRPTSGDTIAVVQPSGQISAERFQQSVARMQGLGYPLSYEAELPRKHGFFGGTDAQRIHELHAAFANSKHKAVWCVRGGYGTQRLLSQLDTELIARNPKPFIGFSDITALLNYITHRTGIITYHGIMGVSDFTDFELETFRAAVIEQRSYTLQPLPEHAATGDSNYQPYVISHGTASGTLMGGNLALLASTIGTPYDFDYSNKILFIEDIDEPPYRIDRFLVQLRNAGKLQQLAGIALGIFHRCHPHEHQNTEQDSLTLSQVLHECLADLPIPIVYGLPFGHIRHNATLPIGAQATLSSTPIALKIH